MGREKIRVCIVDDNNLIRKTYKTSLSNYENIIIQEVFSNAEDCIEFLDFNTTDVILMDLGLPYMNGSDATKIIKHNHSDIKVIILTTHDSEFEIINSLSSGARGYAIKNIKVDDLYNVINLVYKGSIWIAPDIVNIVNNIFRLSVNRIKNSENYNLTEREHEVLKLLVLGLSNTEIADELFISSHTAKVHVSNILSKLSVTDRVQAAVKAYQYNLC